MKHITHPSKTEQALALVRTAGVLRARDLARHGISSVYLRRLVRRGLLVQPARGLYRVADGEVTEHYSLTAVSLRLPRGVICLLSALQFHGLTTQVPSEIWLAVDRKARKPVASGPAVRVVRFSGPSLKQGVETHKLDGVAVRITAPARTVTDCFRYRNKIGLDVALEALRAYRGQPGATTDELWKYARLGRVTRVIRPYLEALA